MKPLTLAEVNAAISECEDFAGPFYGSAEQPYQFGLLQALVCRNVSMYVTFTIRDYGASWADFVDSIQGLPIGLAIARVNRILETIPEPEGVEA